jgi:hypothetical protein
VDTSGKAFLKDQESALGTWLLEKRVGCKEWEAMPGGRVHVILGDKAMELELSVYPSASESEIWQLESKVDERNGEAIGMERTGKLDALRISRLHNCPEHTYLLLLRQARLGADSANAIVIPGSDPVHARLAYYRGEFFISPASSQRVVVIQDHKLALNELAPLTPGVQFSLGNVAIQVDNILPADYKT